MSRPHTGEDARPVDIGVSEAPGVGQELTTEDIDEVAFDACLSAGERRRQLMGLLEEVRSRSSADFVGDMETLSTHLRDRITSLAGLLQGKIDLGFAVASPTGGSEAEEDSVEPN